MAKSSDPAAVDVSNILDTGRLRSSAEKGLDYDDLVASHSVRDFDQRSATSSQYERSKIQVANQVRGKLADSFLEAEQFKLDSEYKLQQVKLQESFLTAKALENIVIEDPLVTPSTIPQIVHPICSMQVSSNPAGYNQASVSPTSVHNASILLTPTSHCVTSSVQQVSSTLPVSSQYAPPMTHTVYSSQPMSMAHSAPDPRFQGHPNAPSYSSEPQISNRFPPSQSIHHTRPMSQGYPSNSANYSSHNYPRTPVITPTYHPTVPPVNVDPNPMPMYYGAHHPTAPPVNANPNPMPTYYGAHHPSVPPVNANPNPMPTYYGAHHPFVPPANINSNPMPTYTGAHYPFVPPANIDRKPLPSPSVFSGDPLQYPSWKCSFDTLVLNSCMHASERIYYLRQYVSGKALEAIEGFLFINDQNSFDSAMRLLDSRFGNNFLVGGAFRNKLASWPKVSNFDRAGLRSLSDFLSQCLAAKERFSLHMLDDEHENVKILEKLPNWVTTKWSRIVFESRSQAGRFPLFSEFVYFLSKESDMANDPIFSHFKEPHRDRVIVHSTDTAQKHPCSFCSGDHFVNVCKKFLELSLDEKRKLIMEKRLCYSCLKTNHMSRACQRKLICDTCKKPHPTSMHYSDDNRATSASINSSPSREDNTDSCSDIHTSDNRSAKATSLFSSQCVDNRVTMILPVYVSHIDNPEKESLVYCMLDTQSDSSFVSSDLLSELNVSGEPIKLSLSTMDRSNHLVNSFKVRGLRVRGYRCSKGIDISLAYSRESIPGNRCHIPTPSKFTEWSHLDGMRHELVEELDVPIALLIGYNCPAALIPKRVIPSSRNGPYAEFTNLGWGVIGLTSHCQDGSVAYEVSTPEGSISHFSSICLRSCAKETFTPHDLSLILESDFKDMELASESHSIQDKRFLSILDKGVKQRSDKHIEMPLPFKACDRPELPSNDKVAFVRLSKLKDRFIKDPSFFEDYCHFMDELFRKGYARKLTEKELSDPGHCWYLPHQGVYNVNKPDKIRVVFDASVRHQGVCLNDELLQGPILTFGCVVSFP